MKRGDDLQFTPSSMREVLREGGTTAKPRRKPLSLQFIHEEQMCLSHLKGEKQSVRGGGGGKPLRLKDHMEKIKALIVNPRERTE